MHDSAYSIFNDLSKGTRANSALTDFAGISGAIVTSAVKAAEKGVKKGIDAIRAKITPKRRFVNSISMSCESAQPNVVDCYRQAAMDMKQNFIIMSKLNEAGVASIVYNGVDKRVKFFFNDKASNDPIENIANIANTLDELYYGADKHYMLNSVPTTTSIASYDSRTDTINLDDARKRMSAMLDRSTIQAFKPVTGTDSFGVMTTRCDLCPTEVLFGSDYSRCDERLVGSGNSTPYKRALAKNLTQITGVDAHDFVTSLYFDGAKDAITADADSVFEFMQEADLTEKQLIGVMVSASSEFLLKASMAEVNIHKDIANQINQFNRHLDVDEVMA